MNRITTEKRWTDHVEPALAILATLQNTGRDVAGMGIRGDAAHSNGHEVRGGSTVFVPEDLLVAAYMLAAVRGGAVPDSWQAEPPIDDSTNFATMPSHNQVEPAISLSDTLVEADFETCKDFWSYTADFMASPMKAEGLSSEATPSETVAAA